MVGDDQSESVMAPVIDDGASNVSGMMKIADGDGESSVGAGEINN